MNKNIKNIIIIFILQCVAVSGVGAQQAPNAADNGIESRSYEENLKRWKNMSEQEREAIRQKVREIDPQQRKKLRDNAEKFRKLPGKDRQRLKENFHKFRQLPERRRTRMRQRARRFQGLSKERKTELRRKTRKRRSEFRNRREGIQKHKDIKQRQERKKGQHIRGSRNGAGAGLRVGDRPQVDRQNWQEYRRKGSNDRRLRQHQGSSGSGRTRIQSGHGRGRGRK